MSKSLVLASLLTLLLAAAPSACFALQPHVRDAWSLGLSYGGATGEASFAVDGATARTEDGVCPQIRLARMVGDHLAVGVSYAGWVYETGVWPTKYRFNLQNILLSGTWYPGSPDTPLGGLYLRAGAGLGWSSLGVIELEEGEEQGHGERITDTGLGMQLNLGYEFRLVSNMAAGVGVGVDHQILDGEIYDRATFYSFTLNLGWYWN